MYPLIDISRNAAHDKRHKEAKIAAALAVRARITVAPDLIGVQTVPRPRKTAKEARQKSRCHRVVATPISPSLMHVRSTVKPSLYHCGPETQSEVERGDSPAIHICPQLLALLPVRTSGIMTGS